ncbi:M24 family metallopeptidase [Chloroflexota bacterium]
MSVRLARLLQRLEGEGLDSLLVSQAENRRYLSGFTGSAGYLLISPKRAVLAVDFRYVEQASDEAPEFEVIEVKGELHKWLPSQLSDMGEERIGFEAASLSFSSYSRLAGAAEGKFRLVPTETLVESLRAVKEEEELASLRKVAALADAAVENIAHALAPGITEKEAAWRLEDYLRKAGSESLPFDLIVASGPNSARPHARPTDRLIGPNEPVVIDIGARVGGYASDISRTLFWGEADETFRRVYDTVLGAQLVAIATIEAGMSGDRADRLARTVIEEAGYGEAFGHGLGHGIGLAAHEEPRLGPSSDTVLAEGMAFTIEPGIYLPGWGGVRIEDMVVLERGRAIPLTRAKKTGEAT